MESYKDILTEQFNELKEWSDCVDNRLQFLGNTIFDFTTYSDELDEMFAKNMIEVLKCIHERKTFDYLDISDDKYINYITMVNMPFLVDKLEWGGSIRGAWLDDFQEYEISGIKIERGEFTVFINDLIEWSNEQ